MRKFLALWAIAACSLLIAVGPTSAQFGSRLTAPSDVIHVQSRCSICKGNCLDSIDCSDFCPKTCGGACRARFQKALNTCLKRCGTCKNPA